MRCLAYPISKACLDYMLSIFKMLSISIFKSCLNYMLSIFEMLSISNIESLFELNAYHLRDA
ncbi:hypothetical protein [Ancylomarina longa]|uniref:hypothetical protein n=1 Tax=Ancylomarina longa TaxID=2487017 RepID=UPI0011D16F38|nr:hypothetical protein [Ancylomarina longa]